MNMLTLLIAMGFFFVSQLQSQTKNPGTDVPANETKNQNERQPFRSANLDLARTYEQLKKWSDAEKYFQEAAKEKEEAVWREALLGIQRVRAAADAELQELSGAQYYKSADLSDKAEEQYVAALKSNSEAVRKSAQRALRELESALWFQRRFDSFLQLVKYLAALLGATSLLLLIIASVRIRRSIELVRMAEVGEKTSGKVQFWLAYVRSRIRSLSAVPTAQISSLISAPILYSALPVFRDELPEPEGEIDVAGTKLPLGSLISLYVRPRTKVTGGLAVPISPADGSAFALVSRRRLFKDGGGASEFVHRPIRAAHQDEDLEAFAYDVYVKAVEAHAQ